MAGLGCAGALPSEEAVDSSFRSFTKAKTAFDTIIVGETTAKQLGDLVAVHAAAELAGDALDGPEIRAAVVGRRSSDRDEHYQR